MQASPELVRSIMIAEDLVPCQPRPWRVRTQQDSSPPPADLLQRDFTAAAPGDPLVGDITYIRTWVGWLYLATVIDLYSKGGSGLGDG